VEHVGGHGVARSLAGKQGEGVLAPRGCWCLTPSPERHPPPLDDSCTQVRMTMDEAVRSGATGHAPPIYQSWGATIPLDWTAHMDASHAPTFVSGRETYWMAVRSFHYWPDLRALRTLSVAITIIPRHFLLKPNL